MSSPVSMGEGFGVAAMYKNLKSLFGKLLESYLYVSIALIRNA